VPEAFELGDAGVGFVGASAVPVRSEVVVGLVAFEHPVGRDQHRVRDGDLGPARPMPRRLVSRACRAAR
jgi:hypothetical protein